MCGRNTGRLGRGHYNPVLCGHYGTVCTIPFLVTGEFLWLFGVSIGLFSCLPLLGLGRACGWSPHLFLLRGDFRVRATRLSSGGWRHEVNLIPNKINC